MKILYDYHMHSEISPDAHFSMEAMCESALKNGMREIAFTDHYEFYVNGVVRPCLTRDMWKNILRHWKNAEKNLKVAYP